MSEIPKRTRKVQNQQESWPFDRLPYAEPYADLARNSTLNFNKIPLMGFGTFSVENPMVIFNALSVGYRHLDLAETQEFITRIISNYPSYATHYPSYAAHCVALY